MRRAFIASISTAVPPFSIDQAESGEYLLKHYADKLSKRSLTLTRKLFLHPSIMKRHFAIEDPDSFLNEDPDSRIARFTRWSIELSSQATIQVLENVGLSKDAISGLVVNTCTGYICPGIATYLIENLGLERNIRVYDLVGSGCGGAIPNLEVAESLLDSSSDRVIVSVSVEICSATFQMDDDLSLLVSNALFGDGASAAVIWNRAEGLELIASSSYYVPEDRDAIRYVYKNGQLYNHLATNLPHLVKHAVTEVVQSVLEEQSLKIEDIKHWALHTGGEKIINTIKSEIGLSEAQLRATRKVLSEYGNMSSPTVWFVMNKILNEGIEKGDWCIMIAFGAGLSAHSFLLRMA
ncbi:MAG: type III polyketide synthase [Nitrospirae bacterium]|nr:type III polyketide synthase [Nitrospirota bacterium]